MSFEDKVDRLVELNVEEQVKNVWKNPYIQKAYSEGNHIMVHGWVIRLKTGLVDELQVQHHMPESLKVFRYDF